MEENAGSWLNLLEVLVATRVYIAWWLMLPFQKGNNIGYFLGSSFRKKMNFENAFHY